jgi:hypothetical protein
MPDGPQKFLEIFSGKRLAVLLLTKHNGVVEIEDDAWICALQQSQFQRREAESFEKQDHIMEARLFDDLELSRHTRTAGREHGSFHAQARVMIQALAQTQSRAGRIPVFNYAKGSHGSRNIAASSRGLKAICDQRVLSRPTASAGSNAIG